MKLALLQAVPNDGDLATAFGKIGRSLDAAAAAGADMLLLPELFLPGYNCPELHARLSQVQAGDWIARLRQMTRTAGCGVTLGWAERDGPDVYNAATAISATGDVLAHYRKIQLYGAMERASFRPGSTPPPVFDLGGRRCGLLICYDIEFPGHVADLALRGADLVLVPTANPAGFEHVQTVLIPARAYENRLVVAYANYCGAERGLAFGGKSVVAGPDAGVLSAAGSGPALLIVDLPAISDYPTDALATLTADYRPTRG